MSSFRLNINRRKRRRIEFEGTACIQIEGASIDGKFVKLFNSGSKVSNLQGYLRFPSREQTPVDDEFQSPNRNEPVAIFRILLTD